MGHQYDFYIAATPEQLWEILTGPEGVRQIFFGCELRGTFQPGEEFSYVGPGNDGPETVHVYGTWLEWEPHHKFSYIEHPGPSYAPNHAELESRVTITFEPTGSCTKMRLVNDQFTPGHPAMERSGESWWMILSNIKTLAETGKTLDFGW